MPLYQSTYHSRIFRDFKEIDAANHRRIIRFYEDKEEDIQRLDFEEYFQLIVAYVNALFEVGAYQKHLLMVDVVIEMTIVHNVERYKGEDIYEKMLFRKAASLYNIMEYAKAEYILRELGETHGVRFEFECYDVGHLYNLAHFVDRGLIKPPFFVQTIFGILGGIGPDPEDLLHMKRTADRLFGDDYIWSVLGAGRHQMNLITMGAIMGGNVRTGLEDNVYLGKGELAQSNADLVAKVVRILKELSLDIATPEQAREVLHLKGVNNIGF